VVDLDLNCSATGAGLLSPSASDAKIVVIKVASQVIEDGAP